MLCYLFTLLSQCCYNLFPQCYCHCYLIICISFICYILHCTSQHLIFAWKRYKDLYRNVAICVIKKLNIHKSLLIFIPATSKNAHQTSHKGVVYNISCNCGSNYIGETSRPLNIRIKEHITSTNNGDLKSAVSEHITKFPDHKICWDTVKTLSNNKHDYKQRKLAEAIHIRRYSPSINRDQGVFLPNSYDALIKKH